MDQRLSTRKRKANTLFEDYVLEGKEGEFIRNLSEDITRKTNCSKKDIDDVVEALSKEFDNNENRSVGMLLKDLEKIPINGGSRKKKGGFIGGINHYGLILYLITDAMNKGTEEVIKASIEILRKGVQVLELLSNKDGCAEMFLYELLGKKIFDFFKFYLLGFLSLELVQQNPLTVLNKSLEVFFLLMKHSTQGIGMTMTSIAGYLIYHYSKYYGSKLKDSSNEKLKEITEVLNDISELESDRVVEIVNTKAVNLKEKLVKFNASLEEDPATREELMMKIGLGVTGQHLKDVQDKIKEFDTTMTQEELKEKLEELAMPVAEQVDEPVPERSPEAVVEAVDEAVDEAVNEAVVGGKRKRKTNKKRSKKISKSKKTTRKNRKGKK
jgi:hypothetical protein